MISQAADENPFVFFDVAVNNVPIGRVVVELYANVLPKTVANFLAFVTGENPEKLSYKGCAIHRIVPKCFCCTGDMLKGDGTGSTSTFGRFFADETFAGKSGKHATGSLSMVNFGPNTNGCQFSFCFAPLPHLDGRNVVFGEVVEGLEVLQRIERHGSAPVGIPDASLRLIDCGVLID